MSLNLDKSAWKRVTFGDVVINRNVTVKGPEAVGIDRIIAMEHLDPGELKVNRWGSIEDGTTFTRRVSPGQTLFGKRRAYQRKAAYAEFDAITSGDILVFDADPDRLLPELLPFLVQSDGFYDHALGTSAGSLSPRTNWRDLANFEFDLPPLVEQQRLADLLWAIERHRRSVSDECATLGEAEGAFISESLARFAWDIRLTDVIRTDRPLCYGVVQPGTEVEDGVGLVRVLDLESGTPLMSKLKRITPEIDRQYRRSRIALGDVLVSIVGTIGRTWLVTSEFNNCNIARALARVSPEPSRMSAEFLHLVLGSPRVQDALDSAAFESARKTLNLSVLAELPLPNISLADQAALLAQRARLAAADLGSNKALTTVDSTRRAIFNEVFGGVV